MGEVETGKFLGWYFPKENKVPFFKKHPCSYCYYSSDRAYDVRRHIGKKHAIVNTNNMNNNNNNNMNNNNNNNTSNTLIDDNDECDGYVNRRKPTKFEKGKIIDRGVEENGGDYKEGNGKMGDGEKYNIIKLFKCNFCTFKSKYKWVVRRHVEKKHSII